MRLHSVVTHVLRYGAGLARQTFRSAPLSSPARRMSQNFPPASGFPVALVVSTSSAPAAMATSPKPIDWMGRPFCPAAFRAAGSMQVLASEYRYRRVHEMRIPEYRVKEVGEPGTLP